MKQKYIINFMKGASFPVILAMMAIFGQWQNTTAWIYLALHGMYGILWNLKSFIFPDKSWERVVGWRWSLISIFGLLAYWVAPWILTSQGVEDPLWLLGLCVALNLLGVFLHFVTDMQKYTALKIQPDRLITDGMMQYVRNLNYFGEFMIYFSLALMTMHWLPVVILLMYIPIYWLPNMRRKDQSLSRYPEFEEYESRTNLFIPYLY
jgi:steroid 5-alpha reductase family enzyme